MSIPFIRLRSQLQLWRVDGNHFRQHSEVLTLLKIFYQSTKKCVYVLRALKRLTPDMTYWDARLACQAEGGELPMMKEENLIRGE